MADQHIIICECGQWNRIQPHESKQGWFSCGSCGKQLTTVVSPTATPAPPPPSATPSPPPSGKRPPMGLIGFFGIIGAAVLIHSLSPSKSSGPTPTAPVSRDQTAGIPASSPQPAPSKSAPPPYVPPQPVVAPVSSLPPPRATYTPPPPPPELIPVPIRNGVIRQRAYGPVPLKVVADQGTNYALKLVNAYTNAEALLFYVTGGTALEVKVPAGQYYVRGASGSQWYGESKLFGSGTRYFRMSQRNDSSGEGSRFTFAQGRMYTLTLKGVTDGNVSAPSISAADF